MHICVMCVQICAWICNFLYPLSKKNPRLWSLVEAEWFMNLGHLNVTKIKQNTKAKDSTAEGLGCPPPGPPELATGEAI